VLSTKIVKHGGCWSNAVQALTQWQHPVDSNEARDVLHWAAADIMVDKFGQKHKTLAKNLF
jgi:hypothetical protein